ncbi:MAG: methyltransferase domain-containing protein [Methylobacter sp.]|nr:methyltransferase domain-containing protein [Methylobacter sp.]
MQCHLGVLRYVPLPVGPCRAITAVEIMEHLENPLEFIREAFEQTQAGSFIFTTELFEGFPPNPGRWWYYPFETGQHIAFFQRRTLEVIAKKLGLFFVSGGGIHVFSKVPVNELQLKFFAGPFNKVLHFLIRRFLGTRVMRDHQVMVQRLLDIQKLND